MDLFKVADFYINRMVTMEGKSGPGGSALSHVKALLLDKDTVTTISMCATQSELLEHEIYLVDTVENDQRDAMRHIRCILYVKPTEDTIQCLLRELRAPKYAEYSIFFNNMVSKSQLERLAESDDMEVVTKVEEIFQDYQVLSEDLFGFAMDTGSFMTEDMVWKQSGLLENTKAIVSLLLSLRLKPDLIYEKNSKLCGKLAKEVSNEIDQNQKHLFDFPMKDSPPILILLDRLNDPITPLLQPWTYQSMINEYIGIERNVVDLSSVPDIDKDLAKVTLSPKQDPFFHDTRFLNFGELGDKVKQYVDNYKSKTHSNSQINTIEDIKNFIEKYPEFKKLSSNVAKHMAVVGELDRQLQARDIWALSELEQNISVHDDNAQDFNKLLQMIETNKLNNYYKLKLACIYAIRHGSKNPERIKEVADTMARSSMSVEDINFFHSFNQIFRSRQDSVLDTNTASDPLLSGHDKDGNNNLISELTKRLNKRMGRKDWSRNSRNIADNVYMQHTPDIMNLLGTLSRNRIWSDTTFDVINKNGKGQPSYPIQDVVIFVVGGVTFEESRCVHEFNESMKASNGNIRIVLGGTKVLSTSDFLNSFKR